MKKLLLTIALITGFTLSAQIEGFKAGIHIGLPVGDASDISDFNIGLDAAYMFWKPIDKLEIGVATGYSHYIGKDYKYYVPYWGTVKSKGDDFGFIPIAVAGEYTFAEDFFVGTDLGVAIATKSGIDTGFYFQPKVGWNVSDFQLLAFVKGITSKVSGYSNSNTTLITLGVGGAYKF